MELQLLITTKTLKTKIFIASKLLDIVFILLLNVKMPAIFVIVKFIYRIYFMLRWSRRGVVEKCYAL